MKRFCFKKFLRQREGFTLLELLTVVGIMILIVGISYPLFQIYQETIGVKRGLQILTQTISLAKNMAVTKKAIYYVRFDKDKQIMQFYMESTGNQTLDIQTEGGERDGAQGATDLMEGPPIPLPKQVGFYTDVSLFKVNPVYFGFLPEGYLFLPVGIQFTDKDKFMDDPKGNADLGLIYPIVSPYKCIYIKLGRQRGGIDEAVFDKCPGGEKSR